MLDSWLSLLYNVSHANEHGLETQMQDLLTFAQAHDWGHDAELVDGGIRVGTEVRRADGTWTREYTVCADMRSLRLWAGY